MSSPESVCATVALPWSCAPHHQIVPSPSSVRRSGTTSPSNRGVIRDAGATGDGSGVIANDRVGQADDVAHPGVREAIVHELAVAPRGDETTPAQAGQVVGD